MAQPSCPPATPRGSVPNRPARFEHALHGGVQFQLMSIGGRPGPQAIYPRVHPALVPRVNWQMQAGARARSSGEQLLRELNVTECDLQAGQALEQLRHAMFVLDLAGDVQAIE